VRRAPQPVRLQTDLADVPDTFMAMWSKLADKIIAYFSRAMLLAVGAILVFAAAWGVGQWMESRREHATEVLGRAIRIAEADLLRDSEKADPDADPPRYKTAQERTDAVLKVLQELDQKYSGSDAAHRGDLVRAGVYYDQGKIADAEAMYRRFLDSKPGETALRALSYEGLGLCAEARSDWNAAISAFEHQANEQFARDRARLNQARIYVKQGNKQKAIETYKDILAKAAPQSPLRDDVQNHLAALEP
jgi:predicted negative regulator of RcsB-dependent stress response